MGVKSSILGTRKGHECMTYFWITLANIILFYFQPYVATIFLYVVTGYLLLVKKGRKTEKLLECMVYTTPFYYFSLWGRMQRVSMCMTMALLLLILLVYAAIKKRWGLLKQEVLLLTGGCMATVLYGLSLVFSRAPGEVLVDTYQLILLIWLVLFVGIASRMQKIAVNVEMLFEKYCVGICAVAASVYIQFFLRQYFKMTVGQVFVWGGGSRVIYNSIYVAKSVLSLYLAIGMLYYFIKMFTKIEMAHILRIVFIGGAVLLNNSRTGLMCFMVVGAAYTLFHMKTMMKKPKMVILTLLGVIAVLYVVQSMMESRTSLAGFADDNGRFGLLWRALVELRHFVVMGIGGSGADYRAVFGSEVPVHNFVIQYQIQFGAVAGLLIAGIFLDCFVKATGNWKYYLGIVFLGGMLFANWQNALFIVPVIILSIIGSHQTEKKVEYANKIRG